MQRFGTWLIAAACAFIGLGIEGASAQTVGAPVKERNEAGKIELVEGGVDVTGADGRKRPVKVGDVLYEGDGISTAIGGELQAALIDGGVIAVRPNTQMRITRYQANGDAGDTSVFNLVKGSFRSITGWIARSNPANYKIQTPTATVGVRGTDHEPLVIPAGASDGEPGTYDRVHAGATRIQGKSGTVDVGAGKAGFFSFNPRVRPRVLDSVPRFFQPTRNERLLEGRHERVRQVLDTRRTERRGLVEQQRRERAQEKLRARDAQKSAQGNAQAQARKARADEAVTRRQAEREKLQKAQRERGEQQQRRLQEQQGQRQRTQEERRKLQEQQQGQRGDAHRQRVDEQRRRLQEQRQSSQARPREQANPGREAQERRQELRREHKAQPGAQERR